MNPTISKFGYPETLLTEAEHWVVFLRPAQVTIGSFVLEHKAGAERLGAVTAEALSELSLVLGAIDTALAAAFAYDKINYLCLMMVDREVHFHVLLRYAAPRIIGGRSFAGRFWPSVPDMTQPPLAIDRSTFRALYDHIKQHGPNYAAPSANENSSCCSRMLRSAWKPSDCNGAAATAAKLAEASMRRSMIRH